MKDSLFCLSEEQLFFKAVIFGPLSTMEDQLNFQILYQRFILEKDISVPISCLNIDLFIIIDSIVQY